MPTVEIGKSAAWATLVVLGRTGIEALEAGFVPLNRSLPKSEE
jgi:hypothetical protein